MRRIRTITALTVLGLVSLGLGISPAGADDFTSFEARATAEGFRFTFGAPGFVAVDTFIDGGGPVASSVLDGLGNSQSFASVPYPSDNAISGPGLIAGLTGLPSPPMYPFYVNSSYPTQEKAEFAGLGINLQALSAEAATEGTATSGGGGGGSAIGATNAHTSSQRDAGAIIAEAVVTADMINIGDTLKIASGKVSAKMSRSTTGDPVKASSFTLDGVSIGGQGVGFNARKPADGRPPPGRHRRPLPGRHVRRQRDHQPRAGHHPEGPVPRKPGDDLHLRPRAGPGQRHGQLNARSGAAALQVVRPGRRGTRGRDRAPRRRR
jgi:hypothetical protein